MTIKKEELYKFPFTTFNNPAGWIEPTTFCQLKCPDCYRGTDRDDFVPAHRDIGDVIKEIDKLIKIRNIQTLSISGGEPLLYPYLDEIVKHAVKKRLKVLIDTNGMLLDETRLIDLKNSGVARIVVHIDKYQNRESIDNETDANKLREEYCNLFRKVGGVSLGFIMPISGDNYNDLEIIVPFIKNNADIIDVCFFTILSQVFSDRPLPDKMLIDSNKVFERVKELYGLEYCAYIEKKLSGDISWIFSGNIFAGKKFLGSVDKDVAKFIQEENYKKRKQYVLIQDNNLSSTKFFLYQLINKSTRKILFKYLKNRMKGKVSTQIISVACAPQKKRQSLRIL